MCILLKLEYAKFWVSNSLFSKVIEENPLGVLVKEELYLGDKISFPEIYISRSLIVCKDLKSLQPLSDPMLMAKSLRWMKT